MDADVVMANEQVLNDYKKVMELAELKVDGFILETYATSNIVLMPEEKEMGVLMLDIGAAHTEISVYRANKLEFSATLPVGGDHITSDISLTFDIDMEEAEKLKLQYNLAMEAMITNDHEVKLNTKKSLDGSSNVVKCSSIVKVIEARVKEIYQITRKMIAENNFIGRLECAVITGQGISNITGTEELAVLTLKINQVRTCCPKLINVIKPQHLTAFGMVKYISNSGLGKLINSDVEIVEEPSIKDQIFNIINKFKEKVSFSINSKNNEE